jgi:HK97 gp10 family phage protein
VITATLKGRETLRLKLAAMQIEVTAAMKAATLAGAEIIRDEASQLAPRRAIATKIGHMADHIEIQTMRSTAPFHIRVRVGPGKAYWYGRFSETGTKNMAAHPFLRPAVDTKQAEALAAFKAVLKARLT